MGCGGDTSPAPVPTFETAGLRVLRTDGEVGRFPADPTAVASDTVIGGAFGLAVDGGSVFVLDAIGQAVFSLDPSGALRARIGSEGEGPGEWRSPMAVQTDATGELWVTDPQVGRILRFDAVGELRQEIRTPYPALAFGVLPDGRVIFPTQSGNSLFAVAGGAGGLRELDVDRALVPEEISRGPEDRFTLKTLLVSAIARDTVFLFRNRHGTDFRAWTVAIDDGAGRITSVRPLPLPGWLYTLLDEETERVRASVSEEFAQGDFYVPFKGARVVDGVPWLAPAPSARVLAVGLPRAADDSLTVVVPAGDEWEGLVDATVSGGRLFALYSTELRIYGLRPDPGGFTPPG